MSRAAHYRLWLIVFIFCLAPSGFAQSQPPRPATATVTVVEELATALVAAKTDEERATLLTAKKELQTPALVQALLGQGNRLRTQWNFSEAAAPSALAIFQLAQRIAEQLGDKAGAATALNQLGDVYRNRGNQSLALEHYRRSRALREDLGDKAGMASVLLLIGFSYSAQGNFDLALEHYRKSLAIHESLGNKYAMAVAQNYVGDAYRFQKDYSAAIEAYRKTLTLVELLENKFMMATAFLNIGFCYSAQGDFASALEYYKKSLAFHESVGNWPATAEAQSYVGDAYRLQKNYGPAFEAYQKALALYDASGNKAGVARILNNLGLVYTEQGKESLAREAKQRSQALNEDLRLAGQNSATNAGAALKLADRLLTAETDEERKALLDAEKALVTRELLGLILTRGIQLSQQNDYAKTISSYRLAAQLGEQVGDKLAVANALRSIGETYFRQKNTLMAQEYYQKSLALLESMGIQAGVAQMLLALGDLSSYQQNYGLALWYLQKAITVAEAIDNQELSRKAREIMVGPYRQIGNYEQAVECLKQAVAHAEAVGNKFGVAQGLHYFSGVYSRQSQFELARQYAQRSLGLFEEIGNKTLVAHLLSDLASLDRSQGNYAGAIEHYRKSIAQFEILGDNAGLTTPLYGLAGTYYQQGNYRQALQLTERAAALARPFGYAHSFTSSSYTGSAIAGKAYRALNQPTQAQQAFEEAIAIIETMRTQLQGDEQEGQHFFDNKISPYHEMVGLLVAQDQTAAALAYAERAKARTLLDVLRSDRADVVKALTAEEQAQGQRLKNELFLLNAELLRERQRQPADPARLADLQARQQKARQTYETFQAGLYAAHPELKIRRGEAPALRSEEIAALLPNAQTALLEFVVAEERAFLFALTKHGAGQPPGVELNVYPLAITAKELSERATSFRHQLAKRDPGFADAARTLYDLLLKPAAAQLQGKTALVIVPDGPLWELPFQTLQPAPNRYLIEDCAISYVPSLTVLREMLKAQSKTTNRAATLLAFGNPALGQQTLARAKAVLMDEKFEPLPEAERQVNALAQIYGARQSKVYIGAEAREERAKAEAVGYRILHLATHGVLNDASPLYSHLLLAQTEEQGKEDGLLEAWELMKLDLNADLVVLSACETARGRVGAGEGVIGLTWALFVAGCPRTVVSQWKVESASTTELMIEFHRQLKLRMQNPKLSFGAAQALRASALKMLRSEQYRHPFYWAGFVVMGDGS